MTTILNIKTSINGENSASNQLSEVVINQLLEIHPDSKVMVRDLASDPIPHMQTTHFLSFEIPHEERNNEQKEASKYSDQALKEIEEADILVIGVPFYNFSFPSTLKSWIDHISIPGKTFSYAGGVLKGLLKNKKVYLNFAIGGVYEDKGIIDQMESYLRTLLGFIGITDIEVFRSEGMSLPEIREENLSKTVAEIETVLA
ncbi:FMN-dependent NADH-azoreductase [Chryseobacterium pennae]|uniref:FMN dependent NADH:quinone oxidoreductase n=1 Tax=Chryseobacterium pennae TaxID=2258962 RepID=A0A3D9C9M1_9FLAO|nr:NAD(P)H-dependent oxidoreductase [Chryseobacterium pennae]REC62182.1 FMN-dependent NADH-azoreductase [Chryseobacterium pennae]